MLAVAPEKVNDLGRFQVFLSIFSKRDLTYGLEINGNTE